MAGGDWGYPPTDVGESSSVMLINVHGRLHGAGRAQEEEVATMVPPPSARARQDQVLLCSASRQSSDQCLVR